MTTPAEKMHKARAALVLQHPFFGALALRLRLQENAGIETADVDGVTLRYSPAYVDKLTLPQCCGLWAHEVMHCAMGHVWRRGARDGERWNLACDYAVDPVLVSSGLTIPDATVNPAWQGWSADAIFAALPEKQNQGGGGSSSAPQPGAGGGGRRKFGEMTDPPPAAGQQQPSPAQLAQGEQEWKIAAVQAANAAKSAGNLPGALAELVDQIKTSKLDWRQLLRRFISVRVNSDYRWSPPTRRYLHYGLYLPSMRSEGVGEIALFVDTSGSVSPAELAAFQSEIGAILEDTRPQLVRVLQCDKRVNDSAEYRPEDLPLQLTWKGRGGTDFRPPFEHVEREGWSPCCAIYLTDLDGPFPTEPPPYPVLWISTGAPGAAAPFGETVHLALD